MFQLSPFAYPYLAEFPQQVKKEAGNERPTDDMEHFGEEFEGQVKVEIKM
jgi:hypothetical protein